MNLDNVDPEKVQGVVGTLLEKRWTSYYSTVQETHYSDNSCLRPYTCCTNYKGGM